MFWAEELTNHFKDEKKRILVDDMATPSGKPHVGTLRGAILHDVAAKALTNSGLNAEYTFVCNDFDPMDGLPTYLDPKIYQEHMGKPLFMIPAPEGEKSFSDYYMDDLYGIMKGLGCVFRPVYDSQEYKSGRMDKVIKIALDNAETVRKIYKEISGSIKPADWIPFQPICENCGKIGTTRAYAWDGKKVSYICEEDMVDWAKGCGHKDKVSPFGGTGKLLWKVEWPAHWAAMGVRVEGEGKDHASAGGSRDLANHLCKKVFKIDPPYDIPYEHIIFAGKKMSKSKGIGISAEEVYKNLSPEIIRFIMIRNPGRVIDLDLSGLTVPQIYDEYDRAKGAYIGKLDFPDLAASYAFSQLGKVFNTGYSAKFLTVANLLQIPQMDIKSWAENDKGFSLNKKESDDLAERIKFAEIWLSNYAPDDLKFDIKDTLPSVKLDTDEKKFLQTLSDKYPKDLDNEKLKGVLTNSISETEIQPRKAYGALYKVFLGKDSGPRVTIILEALSPKFVTTRLLEAIKAD